MELQQIKDAYGASYDETVIDTKGWTYYIDDGMIKIGIKPYGHYEVQPTNQPGRNLWRPIALTIIEAKNNITAGGEIAIAERARQFTLGYDYKNDELYNDEQLAVAGAVYALPKEKRELWWGNEWFSLINRFWPWNISYWKPTPEERIKELGKAAALIIAQIDYEIEKQKKELK